MFNPFNPDGFTTYVMQSSESTDAVLNTFEQALAAGLDLNEALNYAFQVNGVQQENLTLPDIERINKRVEAIANNTFNTERRF